jgi:hypothetical protein
MGMQAGITLPHPALPQGHGEGGGGEASRIDPSKTLTTSQPQKP